MKEVQEKLLPGELGVSPMILLLIPQERGTQGVDVQANPRDASNGNGVVRVLEGA